jgi:ribosome hibernation promoting factor
MDVVVFGKHAEVDTDLRRLTNEKLGRVEKYANDVRRIDVDYAVSVTRRADDSHTCEILVHLSHHLVKGRASAVEHPVALDLALDKVEQQMRRLHERRVRRRNGTRARSGTTLNGANNVVSPSTAEDAEAEESSPELVKIKQIAVKPMDAEEAALQMDLLGHDFFLFTSSESGRAAVLYRRRDGNLGLIESTG